VTFFLSPRISARTGAGRRDFFSFLPVGRNTLPKIGIKIAEWFELPSPESITGHCWRRTAATVANAGEILINLKKFCHWKSDKVAAVYIDKSENPNCIAYTICFLQKTILLLYH